MTRSNQLSDNNLSATGKQHTGKFLSSSSSLVIQPLSLTQRVDRTAIGSLIAIALCGLIASSLLFSPLAMIVYNVTDSAPRGWYLVTRTAQLRLGDYVLADLPAPVAELAAQRGYLPVGVPLLKPISATFGQHICARGNVISIDHQPRAIALLNDGKGRPLHAWMQCRLLGVNEFFLLNPQRSASFDSRYFGPVDRSAVRGKAIPLWVWVAE